MVRASGILVITASFLVLGSPPAVALGLTPPAPGEQAPGPGTAAQVGQAPGPEAPAAETPAADAPPPEAPAPDAPAAPPDEVVPDPLHPQPEASWLDAGHSALTERIFWPVSRFDRFFADEREADAPRPASFIRWRNELKIRTDGTLSAGTTLRADLRFPALSRRLERLRLTLSGDTREAIDPATPGEPPLAPTSNGRLSAGLRYDFYQADRTQADLAGGLLVRWPVGLFTRLRLRHVEPVDGLFQLRTVSAGFWQTTTGWGVRQDVDLERPLGPEILLRLANNASLTQKSRGVEWLSELSLSRTFGERSAISVTGSGSGASDAGPVVERWRLATRLRQEAFRRWLFAELEPEGTWTRRPGGGRARVLAVILRLEIQFDESARRPGP